MLKKSEEKTDLIILNYNNYNHSYLLFYDNSKNEYSFKKILKNKLKNFTNKKWKSLSIVHTSNNFILIPEELYIKKNKKKYLNKITNYNDDKIENNLFNNIVCLFTNNLKLNLKKPIINKPYQVHLASILIKKYLSEKSKKIQTYVFIGGNKIMVLIHKNSELYYYNQFNNKNNYLKYLIILYKEFDLNQGKNLIIISSIDNKDAKNMKEKLKNHFSKISINKETLDKIIKIEK